MPLRSRLSVARMKKEPESRRGMFESKEVDTEQRRIWEVNRHPVPSRGATCNPAILSVGKTHGVVE